MLWDIHKSEKFAWASFGSSQLDEGNKLDVDNNAFQFQLENFTYIIHEKEEIVKQYGSKEKGNPSVSQSASKTLPSLFKCK